MTGIAPAREEAVLARLDADYRAGLPYAAIVERYGVPRSTLYQLLERRRVPRRRPAGGRRKAGPADDDTGRAGR